MSDQVVVKLKGDEKELVKAFEKSEKAQAQLTESIGAFGANARVAAMQASVAMRQVSTATVDLDRVVGKAGQNLKGLPKSVRDQFRELTKETGVSRNAFEKIDDTIEQLRQTTGMTETQLERMRQSLKRASDAAEMDKAAKANRRNVDSIVRNIGRISPELKAVVEAASGDLSQVGASGERAVEGMLTRLRKLGPEGERQAAAIKKRFTQSMEAVEKEFKGPLDELRKLGPAGKRAADKIRRELVLSGNVSEAAMKRIIGPLDNLGPKAATVAAKVQKSLTGAADKSTKSWVLFATKMTGALGGVAAVTQGIRATIAEVNRALERQAALRAEAKNANVDLATVQATALQNLTGLPQGVQNDLIDTAPRRIAGETGTGLVGVKELAEAAGIVMSSGVSKPEVIKEVMAASADIMQLSPDSISEFAKAVAGALKASGQQDDASAVRNTASAIIAGMKGSGVTDLGSFAKTAPRALASGALASDGGKLAEAIGAFDALAIAGAASQKVGDDSGDRSSTFASQIVGKVNEFFDAKVLEQAERPELIAKKQASLMIAKDAGDSDTVKRLEAEIKDLQSLNRLNFAKAPGTPLARLEAIHRFGLQDSFTQFAGAFGDATFKGVIDDMLRGGDVFKDIQRTRADIAAQMKGVQAGSYAATLIDQQAGLQPTTPMNIAKAASEGESAGEIAALNATGKAVKQASIEIVKNAVVATEDSLKESLDLLKEGYRPGLIAQLTGFEGSLEKDGFAAGNLQSVIRAQEFMQKRHASYFEKRVPTASGAATMGVTAFRTVERDPSELSEQDRREAEVYAKGITANQRLLADLGQHGTRDINAAAHEVMQTAKRQLRDAQADGRVSQIERQRISQTVDVLTRLDSELSARNASRLDGLAELLERVADAVEVTADNTAPRNEFDPIGAQRAANAAR